MAFDLKIDFSTNDLEFGPHEDAQIIEGDNLLIQRIHNRLQIEQGAYMFDTQLGVNFRDSFRLVGSDYKGAIESAVREAMAPIELIDIEGIEVTKSADQRQAVVVINFKSLASPFAEGVSETPSDVRTVRFVI